MSQSSQSDQSGLEEQIAALIASLGARLYDIETASEGGRKIYRVYIDREGGADIELCAKVSRALSPLLDLTPPIDGEYALEVSSPGIERRLRTIEHFQGAIGEVVKLTLRDKTKIKGKLLEVGDGFAKIDCYDPVDNRQISGVSGNFVKIEGSDPIDNRRINSCVSGSFVKIEGSDPVDLSSIIKARVVYTP